jgi:hypothetical protein
VSRHPLQWTALRASAVCLLASAIPAFALAAQVSPSVTARRMLLLRSDLGRGWSVQAPAPRRAPGLRCRGFSPQLAGVRRRAAVASQTFQQTSQGPFLSQSAYLYDTHAQQGVVSRRVFTRRRLVCVAAALARGGSGASYSVTSRRVAALRRPAGSVLRYRVGGTATGGGQTVPVFLDELVLARGAVITVLEVSSFDAPPTDGLERQLAHQADGKLRGAP